MDAVKAQEADESGELDRLFGALSDNYGEVTDLLRERGYL